MCHSHLTVDFCKIRSKKEKNTFKAIILIKFQMHIDKVVELPFFCVKRITPKESDFFILGSVIQVLLLVSFNAAGLGSILQLKMCYFCTNQKRLTHVSCQLPWKQNNARAWAIYIPASLMISVRIFNNGTLCDIIKEKVRILF